MNINTLTQNILASYSAEGINSTSRKLLLEQAFACDLDKYNYQKIRSKIFDFVKGKSINSSLNWLEDAIKILDRAKDTSRSSSAFFSPENSGRDELVDSITSASKHIKACVFTISDNQVADALISKHQMGCTVQIISDNDKVYDLGSDLLKLKEAGIPVKVDDTRHHMHHKFALIDGEKLINGSYNWTRSADEYNHENLIITYDEFLIEAFEKEFKRLWEEFSSL